MPPKRAFGNKSMPDEMRIEMVRKALRKVRIIRQEQQAGKGLVEFMFELIPVMGGDALKKASMTDKEAGIRNASIREWGLAWRRCPY